MPRDPRSRGVGQIDHPERIDLEEGDDVGAVPIEPGGVQALAAAQFQFTELGDAGRRQRTRIRQSKRLQLRDQTPPAVPVEILGNRREDISAHVHLEFIADPPGGWHRAVLSHLAVRRRNIEDAHDRLPPVVGILRHHEKKTVGGRDDIAVARIPNRVARHGSGRVRQIKSAHHRAPLPSGLVPVDHPIRLRGNVESGPDQAALQDVTFDRQPRHHLGASRLVLDDHHLALIARVITSVARQEDDMVVSEQIHLFTRRRQLHGAPNRRRVRLADVHELQPAVLIEEVKSSIADLPNIGLDDLPRLSPARRGGRTARDTRGRPAGAVVESIED